MGRLFDEWKQKNAETGEKSVNDKACGELVHKRALLIFNPVAGEGRSLRLLPQVVKHMTDNGYACTTLTTINSGSATEYVKKYGAENEIVVCSGGAGTENEVISGIMQLPKEKRPRMGYVPSGSTNDFANTLCIPKNSDEAVRNITDGICTTIDVGNFNGRFYAYVAAFGAFTDVAYSTSQNAKNMFGFLAYLAKGFDTLKKIRPIKAVFEINGETIEDEFILCTVSNSRIIAGIVKLKPEMVEMNDGMFEIILIRYPQNALELTKIVNAITSGEMSCEYIRMFRASELHVRFPDESVSWTLDGEQEKNITEAHITIIHSGIDIMCGRTE